jgi:hypothetical protein
MNTKIIKAIFLFLVIALSTSNYCFAKSTTNEFWVEMEIITSNYDQNLNDIILIKLYADVIQNERDCIRTWHFFREPALRFRAELHDKENRDRVAELLRNYLSNITEVEDFYIANHGNKVKSLDDGYKGEVETYQRMWSYQKKIWEYGSEMTVEAIKEKSADGYNKPSREYQLTRLYHLLSNQLLPDFDRRYYFRRDNPGGRYVFLVILFSFLLGFLCKDLIRTLSRFLKE